MLLDGGLIAASRVRQASDDAFTVLTNPGVTRDAVRALAPPDERQHWVERLHLIGTSIDVGAYRSPAAIAGRLHRMTSGRPRIELREAQVDAVAGELARVQDRVLADADAVLAEVVAAV
jgi:hypothetical protein